MAAPDWLTSRPIAHRGLHDLARGVVENSASAVAAAVAGRYGIEVDLQASADGEAMVHHDDALGRLTEGRANLAELSAAELKRVPFLATTDRMMTLGELCDLVVSVFGDKGRHARTTVGVAVLPLDAAVEVEGLFEVQ